MFRINPDMIRSRKRKPLGSVGGFFVMLVGLAMLAGGCYFAEKTWTLVTKGIHAQGIVAEVTEEWRTRTKRSHGHSREVRELLNFYTVSVARPLGAPFRFRDEQGTRKREHEKGDTVPVIYLETDAVATAIIDKGGWNWLLPGMLGAMGLVFTVIGAGAMRRKPEPVM